ncbi:MAG: L,D-transpeptidase family protein [Verrucomicrobiota bacterium]
MLIFSGQTPPLPSRNPLPLAPPDLTAVTPHSNRAQEAADRVRPLLEEDLTLLGLHLGSAVFLRAFKEDRLLELWVHKDSTQKFTRFRTYKIAALSGNLGPKIAEGDGQVPEGFYSVTREALHPGSSFHLAFNIGFPNAFDREHGRTGSFIMIHGNAVSTGCLAMTDEKIEEIYTLCEAALNGGQSAFSVEIYPFRPTPARLATESMSPWIDFWTQLSHGYQSFENNRLPAQPSVVAGRYCIP